MNMDSAPRDGRYVAILLGETVAFAYFEDGSWIAPCMVGKPEQGFSVVAPTGWLDIPTPTRH